MHVTLQHTLTMGWLVGHVLLFFVPCHVVCEASGREKSVISVPCNPDGWTGRQGSRNEKLLGKNGLLDLLQYMEDNKSKHQ